MLECAAYNLVRSVSYYPSWRESPLRTQCKCNIMNAAVEMAKEETIPSGGAAASRKGGPRDAPRGFFPPAPGEGLRLVHAFYGVKHAALREAIIKLVEELSTIQKGGS